MKGFQVVLPFAALAAAFVIPEDAVMNQINLERDSRDSSDKFSSPHELFNKAQDKLEDVLDASQDTFDSLVDSVKDTFEDVLDAGAYAECEESLGGGHHRHPKDPHHTNLTIYQLITSNKYTTKFAKLVDEFPEAVKGLNATAANVTLFVPTDKAFERIPDHGHKPSKELLAEILLYHTLPDIYPAGRVLGSHTLPTLLNGTELSAEPGETPQRINVKLGLTGLFLNSYARVVFPNVFASNGVVHAIDHILISPRHIAEILTFVPQEFSTFELALLKTEFKPPAHLGSTLFAPPNFAWSKLGPRANAFLFSKYGTKYLKAILQYHVVLNQTLYSDAFYVVNDDKEETSTIPKGLFHVDLPTLLDGKSLGVDVARYGRFIELKVNAFTRAVYQDAIARDGVIQVVDNVLIPPKKIGGEEVAYNGEELTIDEIKERLQPYVDQDDTEEPTTYDSLEL